jgi:hypothetical protein
VYQTSHSKFEETMLRNNNGHQPLKNAATAHLPLPRFIPDSYLRKIFMATDCWLLPPYLPKEKPKPGEWVCGNT